MNKKSFIIGVIGIVVVLAIASISLNLTRSSSNPQPIAAAPAPAAQVPAPIATPAASTVPLMQSTGAQFSQYKYFSKAHEIYPVLATDAAKALGAFSYTKEDLGNGVFRFTLTNSAEGYKGSSVTVGQGQSVYFIEPSMGDDSSSEDSITTDDSLMAVDAQGTILK